MEFLRPSIPAGGARGAARGAGRGRAKFNDPEDIQFIKILKGHERQITALLIDAANNQASFCCNTAVRLYSCVFEHWRLKRGPEVRIGSELRCDYEDAEGCTNLLSRAFCAVLRMAKCHD